MSTSIKWRDNEGNWQNFDLSDIEHMSRNHALFLFSGTVPVIAKVDNDYLTNNEGLLSQYRSQKKKIKLFSDCERSESMFSRVGFTGPV